MKSVLVSEKPIMCDKIANGKKTIIVKQKAPKEVPFKAYIYETKGKKIECGFHLVDTGITLREKIVFGMHKARVVKHYRNEGEGKVIGEFICDKVDEYNFHEGLTEFNSMGLPSGFYGSYLIFADDYESMCLSYDEVKNYGKGKTLYGWHISDLKIYDKPRALSEFGKVGFGHEVPLERPCAPWCYVEDLKEKK